jgi:hypothetical protein
MQRTTWTTPQLIPGGIELLPPTCDCRCEAGAGGGAGTGSAE